MASKAAFTAEEWNQVLGGVFMAGFAVTAADPSGLWGLLKETFASGRALMDAKSNASASELSQGDCQRYGDVRGPIRRAGLRQGPSAGCQARGDQAAGHRCAARRRRHC